MIDPKVAQVVEAGARAGIQVRALTFPEGTRTAADAAREVGCSLDQIVKSLVFQAGEEPVLFLVSGAHRLDVGKAMAAAQVPSLDKADASLAKRATGYSIGATPPFGHATSLRIFMDEHLLDFSEVWAAAGRPDSVFPVDPRALAAATAATVCSLA